MVVGSAKLSIAHLLQPTSFRPVAMAGHNSDASRSSSVQYTPSMSILARNLGRTQSNNSISSLSPYARIADTMRSSLIASGMDPKSAMHVSQTATGCRIDLMLQGLSSRSPETSINSSSSTTAAVAAARASMAMFKASLPAGVVLSENWYTWLHVHALSDCIDACVEEIREIFGDKGGDENEVAMGAGDTDLAFSRLLGVF